MSAEGFAEAELLPLSAIQHYLYCPRRCALVHIEQAWAENQETAHGRVFHEVVHGASSESRGDVRVARDLHVRSLRLGLTGKLDLVEFHRAEGPGAASGPVPGAPGWWMAFPVEYKSGEGRQEQAYEAQLCAQAICLEEMLGFSIDAGALFYGASRQRLDVAFTAELRELVGTTAGALRQMISGRKTPPPCNDARCRRCSMVDVCMPRLGASRTGAAAYVEGMIDEIGS